MKKRKDEGRKREEGGRKKEKGNMRGKDKREEMSERGDGSSKNEEQQASVVAMSVT